MYQNSCVPIKFCANIAISCYFRVSIYDNSKTILKNKIGPGIFLLTHAHMHACKHTHTHTFTHKQTSTILLIWQTWSIKGMYSKASNKKRIWKQKFLEEGRKPSRVKWQWARDMAGTAGQHEDAKIKTWCSSRMQLEQLLWITNFLRAVSNKCGRY